MVYDGPARPSSHGSTSKIVLARDGGSEHFQADLARSARRAVEFVRGERRGHEDHPRQAEQFDGIAGEDQVPGMHGIERPSINADALRRHVWLDRTIPVTSRGVNPGGTRAWKWL